MPRHARKLALLFTAAVCATTAGCLPVVWLPDSSGFIYATITADTFRLMHYDVGKKKLRVLVDNMPAATTWPALSADGKRVAVAALRDDQATTMQVLIYDLEGKQVRRSPKFPWPASHDKHEGLRATGVFWAGDRIIVHDFEDLAGGNWLGGTRGQATTGVYDLKKNTLIRVEGRPAAFAGTPFLPNGKGFLISKIVSWKENTPNGVRNGLTVGMALVDRQGKAATIDTEPARNAPFAADQLNLLADPWAGTSRWVSGSAEVSSGAVRLQVDTTKRVVTATKVPAAQAKANGADVVQRFIFAGSETEVRVCAATDGVGQRLELVKGGKLAVLRKSGPWLLSPSPNGKWLAAREISKGGGEPGGVIFLIDPTGASRQLATTPPAKQ
jgi:hypothetical protein